MKHFWHWSSEISRHGFVGEKDDKMSSAIKSGSSTERRKWDSSCFEEDGILDEIAGGNSGAEDVRNSRLFAVAIGEGEKLW